MEELYDVVIVGAGPAGLTAALYLARARCRVLVLEKESWGGQIAITEEVVNYPGVERASGRELTRAMKRQAEKFGAEFRQEEAIGLETEETVKTVRTAGGEYRCLGILLATGAKPRTVGFEGEAEHKGRGVAYCATCDGELFTGKDIFVIGGGYAAAEESVFLTRFARSVTILIRRGDFSCPESVAEKAKKHPKITVLPHTEVEKVSGERGVDYIRWRNSESGEVSERRAAAGESFGVFVLAGYAPDTTLAQGVAEIDEQGYLVTDPSGKTSAEGIYAAGDVRAKPLRQVVTATGDGALAATELEKYVERVGQETGLRAAPPTPRTETKDEEPETPRKGDVFSPEVLAQLDGVLAKLERKLKLELMLDERAASQELEEMMDALCQRSGKLEKVYAPQERKMRDAPAVRVLGEDGGDTGLAFHGVPGGHEFTGFVLALYNAGGARQPLEADLAERARKLERETEMKIFVTLSCTLCPELVTAAQRLAVENPKIRAEVYDIRHFPELKERWQVMSVPCLVVNEEKVSFGKKNARQLMELLEE